jgi:hypothetical protein
MNELWKNVVAETIFSPLVKKSMMADFRPLTNERRERVFLRKGEQRAKHERE